MSIADKLTTIAKNVPKVYEAGAENLIKCLTNNKQRTDFQRFFAYSDCTGLTFDSTYFEQAVTTNHMFYNYAGTEYPKGILLPNATNIGNGGFGASYFVTEIYDMKIPTQSTWNNCFNGCSALVTIGFPIKCTVDTSLNNIFYSCRELVNVTFDGEIGQNIVLTYSTKLSHDSLMSLINTLYDFKSAGSTTTRTATLGSTNLAKLSDTEKAIATQKGWTLA